VLWGIDFSIPLGMLLAAGLYYATARARVRGEGEQRELVGMTPEASAIRRV
jgi:hypothetical protein